MPRNLKELEVLKNLEVFSDWVYSIIIPFLMTFIEMKSCYYYKTRFSVRRRFNQESYHPVRKMPFILFSFLWNYLVIQ